MHKLITFDGISGSGKFTNSVKLCDHLGIERVNDTAFTVMKHMIESNLFFNDPILRPVLWFGIVKLSHKLDWQKREIFTLGGFWQHIIECFAWTDISDNRDALMDAFDTIILTNAEDIYPICSFYLNVNTRETRIRVIKRDNPNAGDIQIDEVRELGGDKEQDKRFREVANWLSDRYPFFHIIDASQPEDKVFDEIVRLTEAAL